MMKADDDDNIGDIVISGENNTKTRHRRRSKLVALVPKFDYKNLALVLLFYLCFYSFMSGFYLLLLNGVTSTSVGKQHTLLWTFFYLGVAFTIVVSTIMYASQWEERKKRGGIESSNRQSESSVESASLMNVPPPPPSGNDVEVNN